MSFLIKYAHGRTLELPHHDHDTLTTQRRPLRPSITGRGGVQYNARRLAEPGKFSSNCCRLKLETVGATDAHHQSSRCPKNPSDAPIILQIASNPLILRSHSECFYKVKLSSLLKKCIPARTSMFPSQTPDCHPHGGCFEALSPQAFRLGRTMYTPWGLSRDMCSSALRPIE